MNALTQWNPWKELDEVQKRWNSVLDLAPFRPKTIPADNHDMTVPEWVPTADILEDDAEYLIKMELPEIQKDAVKVTLENGTLRISGERKADKEEKYQKFLRVERYYGRFERGFIVPDDAEANKVKAEFKDGMLRVHLPKSEQTRPKQIEVKVA